MLITIDVHSGVPAYRQLVDQIRLHVATGRLQPGAEIPSTRALSAELGLNPMTISRAYALLEDEGVLERRPGLSLVVRAQSPARAASARHDEVRQGAHSPSRRWPGNSASAAVKRARGSQG